MSKQAENDRAFLARYCVSWNYSICTSHKDVWRVTISGSSELLATSEDHDEALRAVAQKVHAKLVKNNQKAVDKMIKEVTERQAIIGDWTED